MNVTNADCRFDHIENRFGRFGEIVVVEPQNPIAPLLQVRVTVQVVVVPNLVMSGTVELNDHLSAAAHEVNDERPDRHLPLEPNTQLITPESLPQCHFGSSHLLAKPESPGV